MDALFIVTFLAILEKIRQVRPEPTPASTPGAYTGKYARSRFIALL